MSCLGTAKKDHLNLKSFCYRKATIDINTFTLAFGLANQWVGRYGFTIVFDPETIGTNCFSIVLYFGNHWTQWFFNGFQWQLTIGPTMEW